MDPTDTGIDQEIADMFNAIGEAMSAWAVVEISLAHIFGACMAPSLTLSTGSSFLTGTPATAVFMAIENFRQRVSMIDVAIASLPLDDDMSQIRKKWADVSKRSSKFARSRNRVAHWTVLQHPGAKPGRRVRLRPPFFSTKDRGSELSIYDVRAFRTAFLDFESELQEIQRDLGRHMQLRASFANSVQSVVFNLRRDGQPEAADRLIDIVSRD